MEVSSTNTQAELYLEYIFLLKVEIKHMGESNIQNGGVIKYKVVNMSVSFVDIMIRHERN